MKGFTKFKRKAVLSVRLRNKIAERKKFERFLYYDYLLNYMKELPKKYLSTKNRKEISAGTRMS